MVSVRLFSFLPKKVGYADSILVVDFLANPEISQGYFRNNKKITLHTQYAQDYGKIVV